MSDRVLIHFTQADLENEFAKRGVDPNPRSIEIFADFLIEMPIGELIFKSAAASLKLLATMKLKQLSEKEQ